MINVGQFLNYLYIYDKTTVLYKQAYYLTKSISLIIVRDPLDEKLQLVNVVNKKVLKVQS